MISMDKDSFPPRAEADAGANGPALARLAGLVRAYAPHDGCFELRIPGVHAIRRSRPNTEVIHAL